MKAAVYYENGPPSVLKYEDVPDPQCHPKGILIRVEAVAIDAPGSWDTHADQGPLTGGMASLMSYTAAAIASPTPVPGKSRSVCRRWNMPNSLPA